MSNKAFDEFVSSEQKGAAIDAAIDWGQQREEWLKQLERLYSKIESFLAKYTSAGQIRYEYRSIHLNEEYIGSYSARQMKLRIGRKEVDLMPIGTLIVGSKGRVDVIGPASIAQLLLVDSRASSTKSMVRVTVSVAGKPRAVSHPAPPKDIQWEWRIVTRPPERKFIEITQEAFFDLIMEVAKD
jgi:hypothetical protein